MIKKIFLLIYFSVIVISLYSQNQSADEFIRLGYCTDKAVSFGGATNDTGHCGSAIYLPESTMGLYKGNQITSLKFMVGEKNATDFKLFITSDLNKESYDYVQEVTQYTSNRWNEIVLNQPYDIDGKAIYIGFELVKTGYVLLYTETYEKGEQYAWQGDKWEKSNNSYAAAIYGVVKGDHLPRYDADLKSTKISRYTDSKTPVICSGSIRNKALETIRSIQLSYSLNEVESGTVVVDGLNIAYRKDGNFEVELTTLPEGSTDITCSIKALNNGQTDVDPTNNSSKVHPVVCSDQFVQRTTLLEVYSTEKCPNCPRAHTYLEEVLKDNDQVIEIVHHSGFYTDKFTIPASLEYEWFFGEKQRSAPSFMLDRSCFNEELPELNSTIPINGVSSSTFEKTLKTALKVPAFASVNLTLNAVNNSRNVSIRVEGEELLSTDTDSNHRLFIYLTEDNIVSDTQSSGGKGYVHTALLRRCITDTWGDTITLRQGYNKEYSIEIPDTFNIENLHVIAAVGNVDKNDVNNCRIYNAATAEVKSVTTGISHSTEMPISFEQCGNTLILSSDCQSINLYSCDGILRKSGKNCRTLSLEGLNRGTYIVRIQNEKSVSVNKIQLTRR